MKAKASADACQKPVMPDGSPSGGPLARKVDGLLEVYALNVSFQLPAICSAHENGRRHCKEKSRFRREPEAAFEQ
ncbi:hypothetical protein [Paraburkholderia caribensis]|uniref:hypothetical protein n=1 Tax=Paraburkholderia caribensis TaxID=75105 RepID=UPI0015928C7C|nr:hypothetical protein [Paraburkholderia caribensis]